MPKCTKCVCMLSPDFMFNEDLCVFCRVGKENVTVDKPGELAYDYTKKSAIEDYRIYLRKLSDKPTVAKFLLDEKMKKVRE